MADGTFRIVFASGVLRFDASANLFVHLRHSKTDAHPVVAGGAAGALPETERRGRFLGGAAAGVTSGSFHSVDELIRGFTVEVKGYTAARLDEEGRLVVEVDGVLDPPAWAGAGELVLGREGDALRIWAKSSFPEGVTLADGETPAPPKPATAAKAAPATKKAEPAKKAEPSKAEPVEEAEPAKRSEAEQKLPPKPESERMARARGEKLPTDAPEGETGVKAGTGKMKSTVESTPRTAGSKPHDPGGKKAGLGCATLVAAAALGAMSLALLLA